MWRFLLGVVCGLVIAHPQKVAQFIYAGFVAAHNITMHVLEWAQTQ